MQTTVRAVNEKSPLYDHLMQIENADDTDAGWQLIHDNLDVIKKHESIVIEQAKEILAGVKESVE
jgi:hypothetical protein